MRRLGWLAVSIMLGAGTASAQSGNILRDARDQYVPTDAPSPAANWADQPWWVPLAECASAYRAEPADKDEFQKFAGHAMMRLADDRGIKAEEAAAIVLPWTGERGMERAQTMISFFGIDAVRTNCGALFTQYRAR